MQATWKRLILLGALLSAAPVHATLFTSCSVEDFSSGFSQHLEGEGAVDCSTSFARASYGFLTAYYAAPFNGTASSLARFSQQVTIDGRPAGTPGLAHLYCEFQPLLVTSVPCDDSFFGDPANDFAFQFGVPFELTATMGGHFDNDFASTWFYRMDVFDETRIPLHTFGCVIEFPGDNRCTFFTFMEQAPTATYTIPGDPTAIPEPATVVMTGIAIGVLALRRRLTA